MRRQRYGRIVNFASRAAENATPGLSAYGASKAGIFTLTQCAASEVAGDGILVNALIPGDTRTAMNPAAKQEPEAVYPYLRELATLPAGGPSGKVFRYGREYPLFQPKGDGLPVALTPSRTQASSQPEEAIREGRPPTSSCTDLVDEGHDAVLDNLQERGGLDGITVACNYHHSRDVFPHNPRHRVIYFTGEHFFEPDRRRYGRIQPVVSPLAERDPLRVLVTKARQRGMAVRGWVNFLHNSRLGQRYPECAVANAFGDRYLNALCPANPDCRAYVRAFGGDLGTYGLEAIRAESVGYMPFEHGYHHERCFVPLSPVARFLMGVCFCDALHRRGPGGRHRRGGRPEVRRAGARAGPRRGPRTARRGAPHAGGRRRARWPGSSGGTWRPGSGRSPRWSRRPPRPSTPPAARAADRTSSWSSGPAACGRPRRG